jgi:hypothetical protein
MNNIQLSYSVFKSLIGTFAVYYSEAADGSFNLYTFPTRNDANVAIISSPADIADFDATIRPTATEVESQNEAIARSVIANASLPASVQLYTGFGEPVPHGVNNIPIFATTKSDATKATLYSFDWTDRTTWYPDSVRVVNEAPASLGAGAYQLAHTDVIDTYHGNLTGEDFLLDAGGFSYRVAITVDGTPQTEQNPALGAGGDFTVDYYTGVVQFLAGHEPGGGAAVLVTYHYATTSRFIIKPLPGRILTLDNVECQFSEDVIFNDSISFQPMGPWEFFAPGLGLPPGTMIPLGNPVRYKGMKDIFNDATRAYPKYPALGGPSWRGSQTPTIVCCWDYIGATVLQSSLGIEIWLSLDNNIKFGGDFATATFYCTSSPEA